MSTDHASTDLDTELDAAWAALDEGDVETALERIGHLPTDQRETWVLRATAQLELDDVEGARAAVARARELSPEAADDPRDPDEGLDWLRGEIALRSWQVEEARGFYERLAARERSPLVLSRLSLCSDLTGDFEGADRLLAEAGALDPEDWPLPPRLSEEEFGEVVDEAIGRLPGPFQQALESTRILVAPVPDRALVGEGLHSETPPDMLGLFVGASALETSVDDSGELPPSIYLFQRNLERWSLDRSELVSEIRVTLYHEIGHLFGFDEDGVDGMGLE